MTYHVTLIGEDGEREYQDVYIVQGGVLKCHGTRVEEETWFGPGCWKCVRVLTGETNDANLSTPATGSAHETLALGTYVGEVTSFEGSSGVVVVIDGENHSFSMNDAVGEVDSSVVMVVVGEQGVELHAIEDATVMARKWWEVPGVHRGKVSAKYGSEVVITVNGTPGKFPESVATGVVQGGPVTLQVMDDLTVQQVVYDASKQRI